MNKQKAIGPYAKNKLNEASFKLKYCREKDGMVLNVIHNKL